MIHTTYNQNNLEERKHILPHLTMQNTVGKLMGRIVIGNSPEASRTGIYSPQIRRSDQENAHGKNAAAFAYNMYEGFQGKEQTVAVAIDLEDVYKRVQFKLLMDLFIQ